MESKTNTNRHKQTNKTDWNGQANRNQIVIVVVFFSSPPSPTSLLLFLLRFYLLIYFHSHLLQRQQNISSCKVSGEINSASGATHTTCNRDLDPSATPDPSTLSPAMCSWFLMKYDFVRQPSAKSESAFSIKVSIKLNIAHTQRWTGNHSQLIITNECTANWRTG